MNINGLQLTKTIEIDRMINIYYQEFLPGVTHKLATRSGWGLIYAERGKLAVSTDRDRYVLGNGEMIFLAPMEEYSMEPCKDAVNVISIQFVVSGAFSDWDKKVYLLNYQQKHYLHEIVAISEKLQQTADEDAQEKAVNGQMLKNIMELLVLSMITGQRTGKKEFRDGHLSFVERKNIADDIVQYLHNQMGEPLKLQDIADQFSYSLSSVKRIFKKATGQSIIHYQNDIRIAEAKRLLKDSNTSIQEISNSLGFVNAGYFARSFKNREGMSPSAYRKMVKKQGDFDEDGE